MRAGVAFDAVDGGKTKSCSVEAFRVEERKDRNCPFCVPKYAFEVSGPCWYVRMGKTYSMGWGVVVGPPETIPSGSVTVVATSPIR